MNRKQEEELFSSVTVPRLWRDNWNNCGDAALQKEEELN